jgi:hypothetical protein
MPYVISHYFKGGTKEQYDTVVGVAHPGGALPAGQTGHAAGPCEGGWLVVAIWDSKDSYDTFLTGTLLPALSTTPGAFAGPPEERAAEVERIITA